VAVVTCPSADDDDVDDVDDDNDGGLRIMMLPFMDLELGVA